MPDLIVYRTRKPEIVSRATSYGEKYDAWKARVKETLTDLGFPGREPMIAGFLLLGSVVGIKPQDGEELPPGWRVTWRYSQNVIVPDLRTKAGKAIRERLKTLDVPSDPRMNLPGMPSDVRSLGKVYSAGMACLEDDTALYVTWRVEPPADEVDTAVWERVSLSEYYTQVEARDAALNGGEQHA